MCNFMETHIGLSPDESPKANGILVSRVCSPFPKPPSPPCCVLLMYVEAMSLGKVQSAFEE